MAALRLLARAMLALLAVAGCREVWHAPEQIAAVSPDPYSTPRLGVGPSGHAVVVWTEGSSATEEPDGPIRAVRLDPAGTWTAPEEIGTGYGPSVAVDPSGSAVAVWQQGTSEASRVFASRYTPGLGWGAVEMLCPERAVGTDVAMDAAGNALVVFDTPEQVTVRRHDGFGWRDPEVANPASGGLSGPQIAMNAAGDAFVWWTRVTPDGADDSLFRFVVNRRDRTGLWSSSRTLGGTQVSSHEVVVDGDGNAHAFWTEQNNGLWSQRFTVATGWQAARQLSPIARYLVAAGDAGGDAVVVFEHLDEEIRAIRIAGGELGETITLARGKEDDSVVWPDNIDLSASSGDAFVIWRIGSRIEVRKSRVNGWEQPEVLDEGTVESPKVEMDGAGHAIAVWVRRGAGEIWEIRTSAYR